jgi:hypothetical protein
MTDMDSEATLDRFDRLAIWTRGDQRAPHKPRLVLYALGCWSRGDQTNIPFGDVDRNLTQLLKEFGSPRRLTLGEILTADARDLDRGDCGVKCSAEPRSGRALVSPD